MENPTIDRISFIEYMISFAGTRTAYSDRCAEEADNGGMLVCAKLGGEYAGYICAVGEESMIRVTYAFTRAEFRRQGIFRALMNYITGAAPAVVRVNISGTHESYGITVGVCKELGFVPGESVTVFTCRPEDDSGWRGYMDSRGTRLCEFLKRHGYGTVSFADADDDIISQIRGSCRSEYGNTFDITAYFDNPARKLSKELSFAAVKDGKLAAYTLVTRPAEKKAVFEQISDSSAERGSGVILLPFAAAMDKFFELGCTLSSYAMYGSNKQANAFRKKLLGGLNTTESVSENYYFRRH